MRTSKKPPQTDEAELESIQSVLAGDYNKFEYIVKKYEPAIYRYTLYLLNYSIHDAEDATSEAFIKAYKNLASYNFSYSFSSWLYRIAHNQAVTIIRKKSKFFSIDLNDFIHLLSKEQPVHQFTSDDVLKVLQNLSLNDKTILLLYYNEEKSLKEIADIFKLSENTIAKRISRARSRAIKYADTYKQSLN